MAEEISQEFLDRVAGVVFADAAAVDAFFARSGVAPGFIGWFNATQANKPPWEQKSIPTRPDCALRFKTFWDGAAQVFGATPSFTQFVCLMSIFINEVGGDLQPIEEHVNSQGHAHPGIAYAFDAIPGLKHSYNTLSGNRTAFDLFRDPTYRAAHGHKALADRFPTPDAVGAAWKGESWPQGFPTFPDPAQTGFLLEADFFKFRGRGLIQTTGRANYLKLIDFVKTYAGTDLVLQQFSAAWKAMPSDTIATTSGNSDWSRLFLSGTLEVARQAIRLHNAGSGNYLALSGNAAQLNGTGQGSVFRMGKRISGSDGYAALFQKRVTRICDVLATEGVGV